MLFSLNKIECLNKYNHAFKSSRSSNNLIYLNIFKGH